MAKKERRKGIKKKELFLNKNTCRVDIGNIYTKIRQSLLQNTNLTVS